MVRNLLWLLIFVAIPITEKSIAQRSKERPPEIAWAVRPHDMEYSKDVILANKDHIPKLVLGKTVVIDQVGFVHYFDRLYQESRPVKFKVFQVVNSTEAILSFNDQHYWLSGINTETLADGNVLQLPFPVKIVGTKSYTTAIGSQKTIDHLVAFTLPKELLDLMEQVKNEKPDGRYLKIRAWEIGKNKFKVARFHSYDRKNLKLELPYGEIISYEYGEIPSKTRKLAESINRFIERQQEKK